MITSRRGPARVEYSYQDAAGCGATEAPRGLLYHRYAVNSDGTVREAKIVPPTSQNQAQIEADLRGWVPQTLSDDDAATSRGCENLVRCYRPLHQLFNALSQGKNRPHVSTPRTLIVGIGSPHGDDQAGWLVADRLSGELVHEAVAVRKATSPADLLDWVDDFERLIICDACRGMTRAGSLNRWMWPAGEIAEARWSGTHDLALPGALRLAAGLGRLPDPTVIWAVEGSSCDALAPLSAAIATAVPKLPMQSVGNSAEVAHARTLARKSPVETG